METKNVISKQEDNYTSELSSCNPWLSIWFHPSMTVRYLIQTKSNFDASLIWILYVVIFTAVSLAAFHLGFQDLRSKFSSFDIKLAVLRNGVLLWSLFYTCSYCFWRLSNLFGGISDKFQMRVVMAWTFFIPNIIAQTLAIVFIVTFGDGVIGLVSVINIISLLWYLTIVVCGIREAANISALRAVSVVILTYCLLIISYSLIITLLTSLFVLKFAF